MNKWWPWHRKKNVFRKAPSAKQPPESQIFVLSPLMGRRLEMLLHNISIRKNTPCGFEWINTQMHVVLAGVASNHHHRTAELIVRVGENGCAVNDPYALRKKWSHALHHPRLFHDHQLYADVLRDCLSTIQEQPVDLNGHRFFVLTEAWQGHTYHKLMCVRLKSE